MSRQFDDYYDALPEPIREIIFEESIDYDSDDIRWKRIPGYPNYLVSRDGEVMSVLNGKAHVLSTWKNQHGHKYVQIQNEDGPKKFLVHRLVMETFKPWHSEYQNQVRHLDDNPANNYISNLEWGTAKDNRADCIRNGHDFRKAVYCYELEKSFRTCADAALYFGTSRSDITNCCQGKINTVKGYHLCYLSDLEEKLKDEVRWTWKSGNLRRVKAINCKTGEEIIFRSRKEASEKLGVSDSGISSTIAGRLTQSGGWIFEDMEAAYG